MVAAAIATGIQLFHPMDAQAQITFGPLQNNPFGLMDIGYNSSPEFADLDNDGDLDIMTDDGGYYYGDVVFGYFENIGSATTPIFNTVVYNPFSLTGGSRPALADLDNDGDMDLMVVYTSGGIWKFKYFQNIGTADVPEFAAWVWNPFGLTGEALSSPTFVDLDNDGDMDLMGGELGGYFKYFQNIGTATSPVFAPVIINPFGLVDIGSSSKPAFVFEFLKQPVAVFVTLHL